MKKFLIALTLLVLALALCACHEHSWKEATCTEAKICTDCGETEGAAAGHKWKDATCTTIKTCEVCGEKEGTVLGHTWKEATCTTARICTVCQANGGQALGHSWKEATCTEAKHCSSCGMEEGSAIGHSWAAATCTAPKTCKACKVTEGSTTEHSWQAATCTTPKTCKNCKKTEGKALGHKWKDATYDAPKTCTACEATEGKALERKWTFTDGGDHIVADNGVETIRVPIDTSHLPQSRETEDRVYTVTVYRERFCYLNGWIVYYERYYEESSSKGGYTGGASVGYAGYSMVKMDGSKQSKPEELNELDNDSEIAGYADGCIYYIKTEGWELIGEEEYQWLCKRTFSEEGKFGEEIVIAEPEGISNEWLGPAWIEDGWVYYTSGYPNREETYKIGLDGTENQKVSNNSVDPA